MLSLKVVAVLPLCFMLAACATDKYVMIDLATPSKESKCGTTVKLEKETQVTVKGSGSIPADDCVINFESDNCKLCFQFEKYGFFNSTLTSLTLTMGSMSKVVDSKMDIPTQYVCSEEKMMTAKVMHGSGYTFNPDEPGYSFVLDIYTSCGYRGMAKSVPFDQVVKHATGYHHGEEMESRVRSTLVTGLVVGLCLASIFLIVLLAAYCYVKNSPNRGASKSAGMPRGNKGSMNVQSDQGGAQRQNVEMVAYKAKEGDRPEGKPLLTGAAAAGGQ